MVRRNAEIRGQGRSATIAQLTGAVFCFSVFLADRPYIVFRKNCAPNLFALHLRPVENSVAAIFCERCPTKVIQTIVVANAILVGGLEFVVLIWPIERRTNKPVDGGAL